MGARNYVWLVLALVAAFLVPAAALNLTLITTTLRADRHRLASDWQQATRGVTYSPPISHNRPFKTLRLNDRIGDIDTVVFGSSTMMGLTADAFAPPLAVYNYAQSGNPLRSMIGEAEYIVERWGDRVKLLVIPVDWALGFIFEEGAPYPADLSPDAVLREAAAARPSLPAQLVDALSLPRMRILAGILREAARVPDAGSALRQVFFEPAGPEYRCADGTPARDFDVIYRGQCNGFRHDGSATFADQKRLDAGRAPAALATAVSGAGQYALALRKGQGEPAPALLDALARIARRAESRGGTVLLLLPPLMPGMEQGLLASGHSGHWLRATKDALAAWSARERIALLDAGDSARHGCVVDEFIDPHHALPACYRKVFAGFFRDHPGFPAASAAGSR
jgi:hypothetical protein